MKHIILLHGLFMNAFSMLQLEKNLSNKDNEIYLFEYDTRNFNDNVLEALNQLVMSIQKKDAISEIIFVGHSMGGLVARLYLTRYEPSGNFKLITMGTPHQGSVVGKNIQNSIIRFILGSSGDSGIVKEIEPWSGKYELYCFIGVTALRILSPTIGKSNEDSDGTVLVSEASLPNCSEVITFPNMIHIQFLLDPRVVSEIQKIIQK